MPDVLVKRAIEQARSRNALVKAMALFTGARVLTAIDKEAARQVFAEGLAAAESLALPAHAMANVLNEAVRLGASADPAAADALLRRLPPDGHPSRFSAGTELVQALAENGDFENALALLEDPTLEVGGAQVVAHRSADPAVQRRAMAAARERWLAQRTQPGPRGRRFAERDYLHLFSTLWRKLEAGQQELWLDEILRAIETDPDQPTLFGLGEKVQLHSTRDARLFEVLNVLRALKPPEQVEAILRDRPEVAAAARIYPLGFESVLAERPPAPVGGPRGFGSGGSGSPSDNRLRAAMVAAFRGDPSAVQDLLAEAHRLYSEDAGAEDPNQAPLVFWPSCQAYREAMYWAGKFSGLAAEAMLAGIPDADMALLASIELAAGTLGLPKHSGTRMEYRPRRHGRPGP